MLKNRVGLIVFFFILFFIILFVRLITVSLLPDSRLRLTENAFLQRGMITDALGKELAISSEAYSLYARPSEIDYSYRQQIFQHLANLEFLAQDDLSNLFQKKEFVWIKRKITLEQKNQVEKIILKLKQNYTIAKDQLGIVKEPGRFYISRALAPIVGFVGIDNQGLGGLEYTFNSYLEQGYTVNTTLDPMLSSIAYEELRKGMEKSKAEIGSIAIIEVDSCEIKALVSYPSFDPNDFSSINSKNMKSYAVSEIYEPGSVMKIFSMAYALENKIVTPHYPTYGCNSKIELGDHYVTCSRAHGKVDPTEIIQKSCNVGMVQIADNFSRQGFYEFLRKFGFGKKPDIPLTGVEYFPLQPPENWSYLSKYMMSIGQEIGVTTLQLGVAASVIGRGGLFKKPLLVKSVTHSKYKNQNYYRLNTNTTRVISADTAKQLLTMMTNVVSEQGTAIKAQVKGISIAGKTGTGQVAKPGGKGYYDNLFNAVFVGFVPSQSPRLVIVVTLNRPMYGKHTGGAVAAPIFSNIVRRIIISTQYL